MPCSRLMRRATVTTYHAACDVAQVIVQRARSCRKNMSSARAGVIRASRRGARCGNAAAGQRAACATYAIGNGNDGVRYDDVHHAEITSLYRDRYRRYAATATSCRCLTSSPLFLRCCCRCYDNTIMSYENSCRDDVVSLMFTSYYQPLFCLHDSPTDHIWLWSVIPYGYRYDDTMSPSSISANIPHCHDCPYNVVHITCSSLSLA